MASNYTKAERQKRWDKCMEYIKKTRTLPEAVALWLAIAALLEAKES